MAKDKDEIFRIDAKQLYEIRKSRRIITGNLSLDIGLGGGIPLGCFTLLGGKNKIGKTTIALTYAASAQKMYKSKVFFLNIEGRFDNKVMDQVRGLDKGRVEVIMGPPIYNKEKDLIGNRKMSAEKWWSILGEIITQNPGSVIIVDSISAMSDEAEMADGMGHMSRGGLQKLEAQFCRQYSDLVVPSEITLFLLAQMQANTSGLGETVQIKCGNAIRHAADAIIFARNIEKWQADSQEKRVLGHDICCRIECSPMGCPYIETKAPLRYGFGLDNITDIINHSINWNMIKAFGAWYCIPFKEDTLEYIDITNEEKPEGCVKLQGQENVRNFLIQNAKQCEVLENKIRLMVLG